MPGLCHSKLSDLFSSSSPFSPLHFAALCFLFFFARPCPTLSQTLLPLFPQSSPHFLLVDNNNNPSNLLDPFPAQTLPTLTIPPALLIPLLVLALIAARQQVHRTLCPSHYLYFLVDFLEQSNCEYYVSPSGSADETLPFFRLYPIR